MDGVATTPPHPNASDLIDGRIAEYPDWRGATLAHLRALIHRAVPDVVEDWKWRGVPVWYSNGILCTGEVYAKVVKTTFANGAELDDPTGLFNASLEGNVRRAIDVPEGVVLNDEAFIALVRAAAERNAAKKRKK